MHITSRLHVFGYNFGCQIIAAEKYRAANGDPHDARYKTGKYPFDATLSMDRSQDFDDIVSLARILRG